MSRLLRWLDALIDARIAVHAGSRPTDAERLERAREDMAAIMDRQALRDDAEAGRSAP